MNFIVLNGSPKGDNSVTMSYIEYLKVLFPAHDFQIRHVAQSIHRLEKDRAAFDALMDEIRRADAVLWAFPLYFLLVHSNYKRFIELIFERNQQEVFAGKYTASFSTSIHFYDHTAHNYMQGICEDLGMCFYRSYSAGMQDLMEDGQRVHFRIFIENFADACEKKAVTARVLPPLLEPVLKYQPAPTEAPIDPDGQKLLVLTDTGSMSDNLRQMLQRFQSSYTIAPEVVDLSEIRIAGGCLGCVKCGMDNECVYDGKDDVRTVYEEKLKKADIIVFALTMKDRYFSARWKNFLDRRFYATHQPGLPGKQIGYLISGPLSLEQNLRQILMASAEIDQANLVDIITDESLSSKELDRAISGFAEKLIRYAALKVRQPKTFLGVGAAKIFRDEMWGDLRFIFQADYRYYKKHGMIDFPQSKIGTRVLNFFIPIFRIGPIKQQIRNQSAVMMHRPHDLVVKKERQKAAK